jgi:hypothetical protein
MVKYILVIVLILTAVIGCEGNKPKYTEEELAQIPQPKRTGLPQPTGGFALAVGNDTVTAEEVIAPVREKLVPFAQGRSIDEFAQQAGPLLSRSLMNRISEILLYQKAKKQAPDDIDEKLDKAVEAETRRFILSFGGDYAKAEEFLHERYGMDWKEFRKYQKRMILSQSYLHGMMPEEGPITFSDIQEHYNSQQDIYQIDESITIRLIEIDLDKLKQTDPNISIEKQAMALANELVSRIESGEDFGELAKQYSTGYRADFGGLWPAIKPESLAEPYDVIAEKAVSMQAGDIAGPIDTGQHILIVKLEDKQISGSIPLEQVQKEIEEEIKINRKNEAFNKAMNKVFEEAAITGVDIFVTFCIEKLYTEANLGKL